MDRRGGDRRAGQQQQQHQQHQPEQQQRGDAVDVEQIMRDIRTRIAQRHGIELTDAQVQELAARRLESILDPRAIKPSLLDQLRKSAGGRPDTVATADRASVPYEFEDTTLYDSPSTFTRFIRKLLNPILKLFFNPNPLIRALHLQARLNAEAARREAERDERQAEWNALHYEILSRIVSEVAKVSLEVQSLTLKVESLSGKVDFNERRVRGIEGTMYQPRPSGERDQRDRERQREREAVAVPSPASPSTEPAAPQATVSAESPAVDVPRRRRRRRRGRRGGGLVESAAQAAPEPSAVPEALEPEEADEPDVEATEPGDVVTTGIELIDQFEESSLAPEPAAEPAPERVTPQLATPDPAVREEAAPALPAQVESGKVESGEVEGGDVEGGEGESGQVKDGE